MCIGELPERNNLPFTLGANDPDNTTGECSILDRIVRPFFEYFQRIFHPRTIQYPTD